MADQGDAEQPWRARFNRALRWLWPRREVGAHDHQHASRSFRYLSRRIAAELSGQEHGSIIVLSSVCRPSVMTETAMMLAASLAREVAARVLLVDGSLRGGSLSTRFGMEAEPGLVDLLRDPDLAVRDLAKPLPLENVAFLPVGSPADRAIHSTRIDVTRLTDALRAGFDMILLAQGPISGDTRYLPYAAEADLVLLVAEESMSKLDEIEEAEALFSAQGIPDVRLVLSQPALNGSAD